MRIVSYNPVSNAFTVYPTSVDTTAQTATADLDRIDSYWTLAVFGPFTQSTLNSALPRTTDRVTR